MLAAIPVSTSKDSDSLVVIYLTWLVDMFIAWAHMRTLPYRNLDVMDEDHYNKWQMLLAKVYVFADRFNVPKLKTDVRAERIWWQPACREVIEFVYGNLPENDILVQLLVKSFCRGDGFANAEQTKHDLRSLPYELLVRIIMQYNEDKY
jgi:hypothetical protein